MLNTAIILAGGYGSRLRSVVSDVPKPMAPINNQPFLNYQLRFLKKNGIKNVIFSVGHLAEKIIEFYGNSFDGLTIKYAHEKETLGTGGGIRLAMQSTGEAEILVLNGDSLFDFDIQKFYDQHFQSQADFSLALRKVKNAGRYGNIEINGEHKIFSFKEKNKDTKEGLINAGVYILNKNLYVSQTPEQSKFSIERDFFEKQLEHFNIRGFEFEGYFIDIGIPEDYEKAQHDFKAFTY